MEEELQNIHGSSDGVLGVYRCFKDTPIPREVLERKQDQNVRLYSHREMLLTFRSSLELKVFVLATLHHGLLTRLGKSNADMSKALRKLKVESLHKMDKKSFILEKVQENYKVFTKTTHNHRDVLEKLSHWSSGVDEVFEEIDPKGEKNTKKIDQSKILLFDSQELHMVGFFQTFFSKRVKKQKSERMLTCTFLLIIVYLLWSIKADRIFLPAGP